MARRRRGQHDRSGPAAVVALGFHLLGNAKEAAALAHPADVIAIALLIIGPLALGWRRKAHLLVLVLAAAASIGYATMLPPSWTFAVAPVMALYAAVKAGRSRAALAVASVAYIAYLTVTRLPGVAEASQPSVRIAILTALGLLLAVFLGEAGRSRAAYFAELSKTTAERARAHKEQEKRQTADERLRIARELHDVLGHHLSLINVQAGVGLHLMDSRPEHAREALTAIKTASSEALREVRAVLDALRPEQEAAPRQPAVGLDRLTDLTSDAGLPVTTTTTGTPRPLPPEVDRAAYRIIQEALTNVRRHALASTAEVAITFNPAELRVSIRNNGTARPEPEDLSAGTAQPKPADESAGMALLKPADERPQTAGLKPPDERTNTAGLKPADENGGPPRPRLAEEGGGSGTGIAGMRARAETLGGTLTAAPLPAGGYLVEAVLPTPGEAELPGPGEPVLPAPGEETT